MSNDVTVSIPMATYDRLRDDLREAQNEQQKLKIELAAAKIADNSGVTKLLFDAFHQSIKVVQFAVGNLDPQTVAGWPHAAVVAIADAIETIPGIDQHVAEMPPELRAFAQSCASYEEFRKERDKNKVVVAATAADFGPQTPEAAAVHAAYDAKRNAEKKSIPENSPGEPTLGVDQ